MLIAAYLATGVVAGFFAGLLGVGGGVIMVPALAMTLGAAGLPDGYLLQVALGTSMATILFTSLSSLRAHHRHGAVLWPVVRDFVPGILLGTGLGTLLARHLPTQALALFFAAFMVLVALQMALGLRTQPQRALPGRLGVGAAAAGIGAVSALAAIGGGAMTVPFLSWCNVPVRQAVGTSAAVGFPIALGGTVGYVVNGLAVGTLPAGSLGFVYLPALLWVALASALTAPLGARLAHRLPGAVLRRIFAALLLVLAAKMLWRLFAD
ncbi:sulfite exporter TauE/SafE family protein [Azospira restricta]|uniref:Probable membrane transporter protein n=1 Tax=Azospira restricta TaxID=404405 RepID=A0A974SPR5_9RHOO|nr:sulfite exporter TauE/SafE family protein [Azospira restricta]QRJ64202.1 sulfite exporter TauE/SafE family protein [Azospira restricta]